MSSICICPCDLSIVGSACLGSGSPDSGLNAQMVQGATYTFFFSYTNLDSKVDLQLVQSTLAVDSNFANPVAASTGNVVGGGNFTVTFQYAGQGSIVGNAGAEAASVLNNNSGIVGFLNKITFYKSVGGSSVPDGALPGCDGPSSSLASIGVIVLGGLVLLILILHEANS